MNPTNTIIGLVQIILSLIVKHGLGIRDLISGNITWAVALDVM